MTQQILIAEDQADVRDFLSAVLTGAGYEVVEAADGAAVLTRLAYAPPAMVLMDLHMPVMDGLESLRRIRSVEAWADVPVLFLTARSSIAFIASVVAEGEQQQEEEEEAQLQ